MTTILAPGTPGTAAPAPPLPAYRFLSGFFQRRTWSAFLYHWCSLVLASLGLAYAVTTVSLGASLAVTVVGLAVPAALIAGARSWGSLQRALCRSLLGTPVADPVPFRRRPGFTGFIRSGLADAAGWRAIAHQALSFVTSVTGATVSIAFFFAGLGAMTHWFWYQFLPPQQASDGSWHRGSQLGPDVFVDTPPLQLAYAGLGALLFFFLWPALNHAFARLQAALAAGLLGPTAASLRVRDLERSRSRTVEESDAKLRRIERDLHDGTQAQLVAIAMKVGDAKERLAGEAASPAVMALLESAHGTAKDALVDLRDLARGIHPPVLNDGLETALETLAANAAIRTSLICSLPVRPSPAVEAIAYFCVMELVTNAVKHAHAHQVRISVKSDGGRLRVRVGDDGRGGAAVATAVDGHRSGLAGLAERVAAVDGALAIDSPRGGPTTVSIDLPLAMDPAA
ncbi:sensor domain-containing protein [Arthrobacter sp. I2-34]|uniref:histidine kinase n=1 Tax=Arthrobacter hankyongi TaxID=2904801 RepID=A0ABS9LAI3_9MICC|nr:sensor histidine kinase [Arthrobacter hankyongi]MCG2623593.1 sensor domain-containing protein [Arthrobacter hankyongi]